MPDQIKTVCQIIHGQLYVYFNFRNVNSISLAISDTRPEVMNLVKNHGQHSWVDNTYNYVYNRHIIIRNRRYHEDYFEHT